MKLFDGGFSIIAILFGMAIATYFLLKFFTGTIEGKTIHEFFPQETIINADGSLG